MTHTPEELSEPRAGDASTVNSDQTQATPDNPPPQDTPLPAEGGEPLTPQACRLPPPATLPVVEVRELDWPAIRKQVDADAIRARMHVAVERMETLLDRAGGPGMLFDNDRAHAADRAIRVSSLDEAGPLWIIGDLHGDLLALEASLALIRRCELQGAAPARIIFLGDFVDDEGLALEVLIRVFELIVAAPQLVCVVAGNHDEALSYDGARFASSVSPSDFAEFLNINLAHEWIGRAGKLALRLTAHAARALFFPDGLLVSHGGFPLSDLHAALTETGDWNDPACLSDFVWSRAHPKARKKLPNRFSRGSQFGYEDFAEFCALSARLGRPITHMARGHDHVDERYAIYPAYHAHPVLTTVALSRRLNRERFGPYERAPTLARVVAGCLPEVHQIYLPADLINEVYPQREPDMEAAAATSEGAPA
ncbi:MAG: metallophosphoesterase [Polyangiales bacterium]